MSDYVIDVDTHSIANQKKYIKRIIEILEGRNVTATLKNSRASYPGQSSGKIPSLLLRMEANVDDIKSIFDIIGLKNVEITNLEDYNINRQISGSYHSFHIKILKSLSPPDATLKKDCEFYVTVSNKPSVTIRTKALSPSSLGLTGRYKTISAYDNATENVLGEIDSRVGETNAAFMRNIYQMAKTKNAGAVSSTPSRGGKTKIISETVEYDEGAKKIYGLVKSGDVNIIGKDFGEIVSLRWVLTHSPYSNFEYFELPAASNLPLVDYFVMIKTKQYGKIQVEFSAKYAAGAAPSLQSILSKIDKTFPAPTPAQKKKIDVLKIFATPRVNQNIMDAISILNAPAYKILKTSINAQSKRKITVEDLSSFMTENISSKKTVSSRISAFFQTFDPYFDALGKKIDYSGRSKITYDRMFGSTKNPKVYSPVLFTTGSKIVDMMNSDKQYQDILNAVARDIDVIQVYLEYHKDKVTYHMQEFQESEFKFDYRANMSDSGNTGMRFSMIKSKTNSENQDYK